MHTQIAERTFFSIETIDERGMGICKARLKAKKKNSRSNCIKIRKDKDEKDDEDLVLMRFIVADDICA